MKQPAVLGMLIVLLIGCNSSPEVKNHLRKMNLSGRVKSVNERSYNAAEKFGEIQKIDSTGNLSYWKFNESGNLTESVSSKYKITYKYDSKGQEIEEQRGLEDEPYRWKTVFRYDDKGNAIEEAEYEGEGILACNTTRTYNDMGVRLKGIQSRYSPDGNLTSRAITEYDEDNKQTVVKYYNAKGDLTSEWDYKYYGDRNVQEIRISDFDKNEKDTLRCKYDNYDKTGNWLKKAMFEKDKCFFLIEREIEYYK